MIVDQLERWERYFSGPVGKLVGDFLRGLTAASPEGRMALQGDDIYAIVASYDTRGVADATLEAHQKYIDVQMSLAGAEAFDWYPHAHLEVTTPYDPAKDAEFYKHDGQPPAHVVGRPGTFLVLFPEDAHMPQLMVGGAPAPVKKVVVKVREHLLRPGA